MDGSNPYAVLGVDENTSAAELKRAFRARALETHPDRGGRRGEFEAVMDAYRAAAARVATHVTRSNPFFTATRVEPTWTRDWVDSPAWSRSRRRPPRRPRASFAEVLRTELASYVVT